MVVPAALLAPELVRDYVNPESLRDARSAVRSVTSDFSDQLVVFPGDYLGGFHAVVPVYIDGPSAGVALAAALIARGNGLDILRSSLVTAAIDASGNVQPLNGGPQLRCKGRLFGLLLQLDGALEGQYRVLYAAEENLGHLRDGVQEAGISPERAITAVQPIKQVAEFDGTLTDDIYRGFIDRYIRDFSTQPS